MCFARQDSCEITEEVKVNDERVYKGGCLCEAVRWRATGEPLWVAHCHCHMCLKNLGAEYITGGDFDLTPVILFALHQPGISPRVCRYCTY